MNAMTKEAAAGVLPLAFQALQERDLPTVAEIESGAYVFPWTIGNFRDSLLGGHQCIGCWSGRELIGYAILMTAVDEAHLLNLAVAGDWQRRGVGTRFLRQLIDMCHGQHLEMLYLEVRPSNVAARAMYERFGFRKLGVRRDYYPSPTGREDAFFLGLNLIPAAL